METLQRNLVSDDGASVFMTGSAAKLADVARELSDPPGEAPSGRPGKVSWYRSRDEYKESQGAKHGLAEQERAGTA